MLTQNHSLGNLPLDFMCSEREAHRTDARGRESESENQLRDMHNLCNQLNNRNQPIQEYLAQNQAEALQRLNAELDACKKRQDKLESEVQVKPELLWVVEATLMMSNL